MFKIYISVLLAMLSVSFAQADAVRITQSANIRLASDINSKVIAWAVAGENLNKIQSANGWTKVERKNGKMGWISDTLIDEYPVAKSCRTADVAAEIGGTVGAGVGAVGVAAVTGCCVGTVGFGCVFCVGAGGLAGLIIGSKSAETVAEFIACD